MKCRQKKRFFLQFITNGSCVNIHMNEPIFSLEKFRIAFKLALIFNCICCRFGPLQHEAKVSAPYIKYFNYSRLQETSGCIRGKDIPCMQKS